MDCKKENKIIGFGKRAGTHPYFKVFWFFLVGVLGMWLTPIIGAICTLVFLSLGWAIVWDTIVRVKPKYYHFCISRVIPVIVCILVVLFYWDKYVALFPSTDPYKQPLQTGTATIAIITEPNSVPLMRLPTGHLQFMKGQEILLHMNASMDKVYEKVVDNRRAYKATFELDQICKAVGKPIYNLTKTEFVKISLSVIPAKSKIVDGYAIFTFNGSATFTIFIPPQTMEDDVIIIQDIQKNLKKGNQL